MYYMVVLKFDLEHSQGWVVLIWNAILKYMNYTFNFDFMKSLTDANHVVYDVFVLFTVTCFKRLFLHWHFSDKIFKFYMKFEILTIMFTVYLYWILFLIMQIIPPPWCLYEHTCMTYRIHATCQLSYRLK